MEHVGDLHMLVVRAGPYRMGIETARIQAIAAPTPNAGKRVRSLAAAVRVQPTPQGKSARVLALDTHPAVLLGVDEVVRMLPLEAVEVQRLSPILRAHGLPAWLLGSFWLQEDLVILIDPVAAAGALDEAREASHGH